MGNVIEFKLAKNLRTGKLQRIPPSIWGNPVRMRVRQWQLVESPEDQHADPVSVNIPSLNGTPKPIIEMPKGSELPVAKGATEPLPDDLFEAPVPAGKPARTNPKTRK